MDNLDKRMPVLHVHYLQYIFGAIVSQTYQKSAISISAQKLSFKKYLNMWSLRSTSHLEILSIFASSENKKPS